jgi:hypothetical protein
MGWEHRADLRVDAGYNLIPDRESSPGEPEMARSAPLTAWHRPGRIRECGKPRALWGRCALPFDSLSNEAR